VAIALHSKKQRLKDDANRAAQEEAAVANPRDDSNINPARSHNP